MTKPHFKWGFIFKLQTTEKIWFRLPNEVFAQKLNENFSVAFMT